MKRKIFSFILTLALVFTTIPMMSGLAYAAGARGALILDGMVQLPNGIW